MSLGMVVRSRTGRDLKQFGVGSGWVESGRLGVIPGRLYITKPYIRGLPSISIQGGVLKRSNSRTPHAGRTCSPMLTLDGRGVGRAGGGESVFSVSLLHP